MQTRYNRPPRSRTFLHTPHEEDRPDDPCPNCGGTRHRITERREVSGPSRPASMGPDEPHVTIRCIRCKTIIEEFDA